MATTSCLRGLLRSSARLSRNGLRRNCAQVAQSHRYKEALLSGPSTHVTILSNGVRVASQSSNLPTATVGIFVDNGSRHETAEKNGITNMFQQLAQKGTIDQSQDALATAVESIGGRITSGVDREQFGICFHSMKEHVPNAVGTLSDVLRNPSMNDAAIEATRANILREQNELDFDMEAVILNYLHMCAFQGTPLAQPVVGTSESVANITRDDLVQFHKTITRGQRVFLVAAGGVDHDSLVKLAEKHLGDMKGDISDLPKLTPCRFTGSLMTARDDDMQFVHAGIGCRSVAYNHPDRLALDAVSIIIGDYDRSYIAGPLDVYSKAAFHLHRHDDNIQCHAFRHFQKSYSDIGLWGMYYISEELSSEQAMEYVQREWARTANGCRESQVERAKTILKTRLFASQSDPASIVQSMAKQLMYVGRVVPLHEMDDRINGLSAGWVKRALQENIYDKSPVVAGVGPVECFPEYGRVEDRMQLYLL